MLELHAVHLDVFMGGFAVELIKLINSSSKATASNLRRIINNIHVLKNATSFSVLVTTIKIRSDLLVSDMMQVKYI